MKKTFAIMITIGLCLAAGAQSKSFQLGKWTEVHSAILKELNRSYVDSLPVTRIEREAVDAMLEALDPYTVYVPEEENEDLQMMLNKSYGGIGAIIYKPDLQGNVIINEPYEGSPACRYGLECCDEVVAIDGQSVAGLTTKDCSDRMKGQPATDVVLTVKKLRTGEIKDIRITRERIHFPDIEYYGMLNETVGYISQTGFTEGVAEEIRKAVLDMKGQGMTKLVLDLRGNGGGILQEAVKIVSLFVPRGSVVVTSKGINTKENVFKTVSDPIDTKLPVIVMVDSGSASASEIVSGALQDLDRATVMGKRTFGKGLVQSMRPLPYNGTLKLTTAKYYTPSGRCVQAIDYSNRNEDGSVGHIPDSLTHEFKTAHGRIVRDGGGITPDVDIPVKPYSRLVYSLVYNGIIEYYALEYFRAHESIPAPEDFHLSDADFEDFIRFAKTREFDSRSSAKTLYDRMREELRKDGLEESMTAELEALGKALDTDKEQFLRIKKNEIVPFIEEEIVVRYYFQSAGAKFRLRYDEQLHTALESPLIKI